MIRLTVLIGLLVVMFYCALAAPARAPESGESAVTAARADWRAQRLLLPGWLVARGVSARAWRSRHTRRRRSRTPDT